MNKEIAKLLNENTYDEDEIESYMNFSDIDDRSLDRITNDVRTRIARGGLKKSGLRAQEMLEQGEFIEKTIKGTDIDVLEDSMMINMIAKIPFMSGDGYSFNRLMFCTNKRIIITSANYYNNPFATESYLKEEIKKISLGKKVKRQFRLKRLLESNLSLTKALITLVAAIPFLFSIGAAGGTLAAGIYFATKSEFLALLGFYSAILGLGYIVVVRPKLITEVLLETKDGKSYDVIIRNEDYKEIHEYLNTFLVRGEEFDR